MDAGVSAATLTRSKLLRKRADHLLNHLTNRLNFLKREEARALLSVSQARDKAYQISKIRHFSYVHKEQLSEFRRKSLESESQQREIITFQASMAEKRREAASKLVKTHKRNDVKAINRQKAVLQTRKQDFFLSEMHRMRAKVREIRREGGDVPLSIEMYQKEKQRQVQVCREYRFQSEMRQRDRDLQRMQEMERERLSITQRLVHVSTQEESV